jgi:hypothetical protein
MTDYDGFDETRVRHLEMIQAVISRLGTDSFLIKGWAVTVSGAFVGFAIGDKMASLALAGVVPALLFWGLDAYFLRAERHFRVLHDAVRKEDPTVEPFFMAATSTAFSPSPAKCTWWEAVVSGTLLAFYLILVISALVVAAILC